MHYRSDIQMNDDGDLYVNKFTNDFDFGPSDSRHLTDIIVAFPGWYKNSPSLGVGAMRYLKSKGTSQQLARSIHMNGQADGYSITPQLLYPQTNIEKIIANATLS